MKTFLLSFFLLAITSQSFAQNSCNIKKANAWFSASMPGAQRADENGNPIDPKPIINRFIYVEYSGSKAPQIRSVTYNGAELIFTVVNLKEKTVWAGDKKLNPGNGMSAKKGNSFLKIDLQPADGQLMPDAGCKNIVIKSIVAGKACKFYAPAEKQFATMPMY